MLAALLEWFLWVAAFLYCIVKVFQKAETMSVRLLSVFFGILFFCLRYAIFLSKFICSTLIHSVPFSCLSWLSRFLCPLRSSSTSPSRWSISSSGLLSGHLLVF